MAHTYKTGIVFTLSDSSDALQHDVNLTLKFTVYPGCEPTREQPGEGPSVSIQSATIRCLHRGDGREHDAPDWLWPFLEADEALAAEMLASAAHDDEYARDQAADARREERQMEHGT